MMKTLLMLLMLTMLCLSGCSGENSTEETLSEKYNIGEEVELGGEKFNIYKIDDINNELYLLAQNNVATTIFSESERSSKYLHDYEGSLIEGYVNEFVDDLEDKGYIIKSSGIIDKDDLIELGFDVDGLNGTQYKMGAAPDFLKSEEYFWVDGYCKYDTYAWAYSVGILTTQKCEDEYGVRPAIAIDISEVDKQPQEVNTNLTIKEIVALDCSWTSEGGIENPYDRFYFDCEKMLFTNVFVSSELSNTSEFNMEFVDDKTIRVDGVMRGYEVPAEITIVNENKLRLRFVEDTYNDGDYYLNKVTE